MTDTRIPPLTGLRSRELAVVTAATVAEEPK